MIFGAMYVTWNQAFLVSEQVCGETVVPAEWSTSGCEFRASPPDGAPPSTSSLFSCGSFANLPVSILHIEQGTFFPLLGLGAETLHRYWYKVYVCFVQG